MKLTQSTPDILYGQGIKKAIGYIGFQLVTLITEQFYLNQLLLRPNLDGLNLLGSLGLDTISVQKNLQSTHVHTEKEKESNTDIEND